MANIQATTLSHTLQEGVGRTQPQLYTWKQMSVLQALLGMMQLKIALGRKRKAS